MSEAAETVDSITLVCVVDRKEDKVQDQIHYCERFIELVVDLEAQLPTRRFFNTLMDDAHVVVQSCLSPLIEKDNGKLFQQVGDVHKGSILNNRQMYHFS